MKSLKGLLFELVLTEAGDQAHSAKRGHAMGVVADGARVSDEVVAATGQIAVELGGVALVSGDVVALVLKHLDKLVCDHVGGYNSRTANREDANLSHLSSFLPFDRPLSGATMMTFYSASAGAMRSNASSAVSASRISFKSC